MLVKGKTFLLLIRHPQRTTQRRSYYESPHLEIKIQQCPFRTLPNLPLYKPQLFPLNNYPRSYIWFFFVFQERPKTKFSYNILTLMVCYLETKFYNFTYMYQNWYPDTPFKTGWCKELSPDLNGIWYHLFSVLYKISMKNVHILIKKKHLVILKKYWYNWKNLKQL